MSCLPANNSYYPLPIGVYGTPPRSPPPLNHLHRFSRSESFAGKTSLATSMDSEEDTGGTDFIGSTSGGGPLVRHPDIWFSDGSIVLRAENTLFRVHKSLLARHSCFFRDLFTLPQPPETDAKSLSVHSEAEDIEGCPVLRLHDAPEDVANLLTALVDGPTFGNNDPADFQVVSGIIRLATKYVVDSLREKALDHLSIAWPSTLKGWDAREDASRSFELQGTETIYPSPIAVINLAREINAPSLLPSAFYDLSRYSFSQVFDYGEMFEEGAQQCALSPIDMQRLCLGKEASQHAITTLIRSLGSHARTLMAGPVNGFVHQHHHSYSQGHTHRTCKRDFSELVTLATQHYLFDHQRGCTDPLYVAEELGQPLYDLSQPLGIDRLGGSRRSPEQAECQACARALETWAKKERERMWKMISLWFRLDV